MRRIFCASGLGLIVLAVGSVRQASATVISETSTIASCSTAQGTINGCADTVYYSTAEATDTTAFIGGTVAGHDPLAADFATAFGNWNAANGDAWTLVDGGVLNLGLALTIGPSLGSNTGGLAPVIANISNYTPGATDPSLSQLAWTQALFTDYTPTGGLSQFSPTITLDTYSLSHGSSGSGGIFTGACTAIPGAPVADNNTTPSTIGATPTGTAYCDPLYPFQYGALPPGTTLAGGYPVSTGFFYDGPQGPWATGAFRGIALLSTVTYDTNSSGAVTGDVLTVYQGINYGFSLGSAPGATASAADVVTTDLTTPVPEPAAITTLITGLSATVLTRTRRKRKP